MPSDQRRRPQVDRRRGNAGLVLMTLLILLAPRFRSARHHASRHDPSRRSSYQAATGLLAGISNVDGAAEMEVRNRLPRIQTAGGSCAATESAVELGTGGDA